MRLVYAAAVFIVLCIIILGIYAVGGLLFPITEYINVGYQFLSLESDVVVHTILVLISIATISLCLSLSLLTLLTANEEIHVLIIIILSFTGIGFAAVVARFSMGIVIDYWLVSSLLC